ncbi:MAG: hypothetical protein EOM51_08065 [Clostridia bacterium]|nr:hypothetical protein [Clostridia bacterium]
MQIISNNFAWAFELKPRSVTTHLILHHAAASNATAEGIHAYHLSKGWAGIAYHYFVSKSGAVYSGRPENMCGGHTANWNYCSIGICFEGNFETEEMPEAQLKAGIELVSDIASRYPSIVIARHSYFNQTACPGKNFPFTKLVSGKESEPEKDAEHTDKPSDWAESACSWAVEKGLFLGGENNNFRWREALTRQELALVLERASKLFGV